VHFSKLHACQEGTRIAACFAVGEADRPSRIAITGEVMNKSEIPAAQKGVLGALMDDHRKVRKIFKDFESEKDEGKKSDMVSEACTALTVHTKLEEELFYPYLRDQNPNKFGDLLDEALVEHASAKMLIAELEKAAGPDDALYDARFTVLGEYVNHHVNEEENELFPKVIAAKIDLRELQEQLDQRRQELMAETGVQ
jgi:hemerythrin superfamily protein